MSVSLRADVGGTTGALALNGADRLTLNADGTLSGAVHPTTGDRSLNLVTMRKFTDEFGALLTTAGYQKMSSGLIMQWATVPIPGNTSASPTFTVSFPIAFPNGALQAVSCADRNCDVTIQVVTLTPTQITMTADTAVTPVTGITGAFARYIAFGF